MATSGMRTLFLAHHPQPISPPHLRAQLIFRSHRPQHRPPHSPPQGFLSVAALHHRSLIHAQNPFLGPLFSLSSSSSSSSASWRNFPPSPFSSCSSSSSSSSSSSPPPRVRRIRSSAGSPKPRTKKPTANAKASAPRKKHAQKLVGNPTLNVPVILEDSMDLNPELEALLERLENDGPLALNLALNGWRDMPSCDTIELSVVICNDKYIQKLNKEWRGKDSPTDVLSFPQDQPPGMSSILLLGDIIISLDTATQQAKERGHSVHDELRILLVHGVLHVLGYDHETGEEDAAEMEKEELRILQALGWNSKGLISAAADESLVDMNSINTHYSQEHVKANGVRQKRSPFQVLLCDMDGTLLNSKSRITEKTAAALKAAIARGVKVIVATGKTRPAVITACQSVGLYGVNGVVSESSPGVFCQGLLVYGEQGQIVHNQHLNSNVCLKVMAIGDGENDIEMLELVGWGVVMANGVKKTLDVANAKVASNDDDGVVEAIERFILT